MPVFALYTFDDTGTLAADSATDNGAQNGIYLNGATAAGGQAVLDGIDDLVKIAGDPSFQLDRGTLAISFTPGDLPLDGPTTILSRDSEGNTDGGFHIDLLPDGAISIVHEVAGADPVTYTTAPGFVASGDTVSLSYSWDKDGDGGALRIDNTTAGTTFGAAVPDTVTMDMGGEEGRPWMVGAGQTLSHPDQLNDVNQHFAGTVSEFSLSDSVDNIPDAGNQDPVANPDTVVTDEDTSVVIPVLANDTDPDGDTLTVTGGSATNGTVTVNEDGTITYTPNQDFNGSDEITYTVSDGNGGTATSTVAVTVNPVNDAPVANDDTASTPYQTPVIIPVLANDTDVDGDTLSIVGTPTSEHGSVTVNDDGTITFTPADGFSGEASIDYTVTDGNGGEDSATVTVTVGEDTTPPTRDGIVWGGRGDDLIDVNYTGDNDGDMVDAGDAILPGAVGDDDYIIARAGNDTILAGRGNDLVYAGQGNDLVYGGTGNDTIYGGQGNDTIYGGQGDDLIYAGPGDDTIHAGLGNDTVYGGIDDDLIYGGPGDDLIYGKAGDDTIYGGVGNDTIYAGVGNDTVYGGPGDDLIHGKAGDDLIYGGVGDDTIYGGPGNDTIEAGYGENLVYGGFGNDVITGGNLADTIYGGAGDDLIRGKMGDDLIYGGAGRDMLHGDRGNDTLYAGDTGGSELFGGLDNDELYAGAGGDILYGGRGNDTFFGGAGADTMYGGADRDVFMNVGPGDVIDGGEEGDDFDVLDLTGAGRLRIEYDPANAENGTIHFMDDEGNPTGTASFINIENVIPCFTPGTLIATPRGEVLAEDLRQGDKIITRDNGIQEIRWVGAKSLTWADLTANPHLRPVLIKRGSLGNGLPERDMMVSPNHRMLVANDRTQLYFDEHEVLVAAKHLVSAQGIQSVESIGTTYIHFMFDRHEVVLSNGAWTESFQPGDYTLKGMGNAQRNEIFEIFPELRTTEGLGDYTAARRTLKRHEASLLVR